MADVAVHLRYVRVAPRKARVLLDLVRGKSVTWAEAQVKVSSKKAAHFVQKLLKSGVAAAKDKKMNVEALSIKQAIVGEGPCLKRAVAHFRGVVRPIDKQMSHLTLVLTDELVEKKKEPQRVRAHQHTAPVEGEERADRRQALPGERSGRGNDVAPPGRKYGS